MTGLSGPPLPLSGGLTRAVAAQAASPHTHACATRPHAIAANVEAVRCPDSSDIEVDRRDPLAPGVGRNLTPASTFAVAEGAQRRFLRCLVGLHTKPALPQCSPSAF